MPCKGALVTILSLKISEAQRQENGKPMNALTDFLSIVGGATAISLLGMALVRRKARREALEASHEVGGYLLAIVGTLYAILVGLIVVSAQAKVDTASQMAVTEANMLTNIYHLSRTFDEPCRRKIRQDLYEYATIASSQDWARVEEGEEKEGTVVPYRHLWQDVTAYEPHNDNDKECYARMLDDLEELSDARKYRMVAAKSQLSLVLWSVLIAGGVMIVLFTYFFFVESLLTQTLMTAFVAIFLSMNIYLIYVCQNPYRPELGAKEAGFGFSFNANWFKDGEPKPAPAARTENSSPASSESPAPGNGNSAGSASKQEKSKNETEEGK